MSTIMRLRVMVPAVWDETALSLPCSTTVAELKSAALDRFRLRSDPEGFEVKYRGARLLDESRSLADHGIVQNANLIVLPRRRRPVR